MENRTTTPADVLGMFGPLVIPFLILFLLVVVL